MTFTAPADATTAVVTGRPLRVGTTLHDGDVMTEVNGRPVFAVASAFAFYRDMATGDSGPDVIALQKALASRGYGVEADGVFGARTERAVRAWYADAGYAPTAQAAPASADGPASGASGPAEETTRSDAVSVPLSEILSVPSLPISVVKGTAIGSAVGVKGTPDLVLGSTKKIVSVSADPAAMASVSKGDRVTLVIGSKEVDGRVTSLLRVAPDSGSASDGDGTSPGKDSVPAPEASLVVTPTSPLRDVALGTSARVTIERQIVAKKSLLVPVVAVTDRGGVNKIVLVRRKDGSFVEVRVTVLGTLDGQAAVASTKSGTLEAGDEVRVG
ncbi:peptidoglycan-binding domain-containing protein [Microbacterium mangrovi]|uniref:peptidoglycan-binding domain-containing protein n=1 Tax=Microbacterium mangrovi TaxID=1348253 RepID=UPI0012E0BA27|nr:peptidoglycan-binding domain-containing protein [Microbacterium mangrovi]